MSKIRIIGGSHRSRLIEVPAAIAGLRPTPDRVRETLFNWLGQKLEGQRVLDLFAGSGALGFEAASRGATKVVMVEFAPKVMAHLKAAQEQLRFPGLRLINADALKLLASSTEQFDLILLDPPYRQGWLARLEPLIGRVLAPGGQLYLEAEEAIDAFAGLQCVKQGKAGQVHYRLFSQTVAGEPA